MVSDPCLGCDVLMETLELKFTPLMSCVTLDMLFTPQVFFMCAMEQLDRITSQLSFTFDILDYKTEVDIFSCFSPSSVWSDSKFIIDLTGRKQPDCGPF